MGNLAPLGALSGAAGGMADAVAGIIEQRLRQAQVANQTQQVMNQQKEAEARLAETANQNRFMNQDRLYREGTTLNESMMPGTDFSPSNPLAPYLSSIPKQVQVSAPPAALAENPSEQGPVDLPGTIANVPSPVMGRLLTKTPTFTQADKTAKEYLAQQVADSRAENDRLKAEAAAAKGNTLVLSAAGKGAMRAIEGSAPLTDQAMAMMEKEFPGIKEHPEQYNQISGSLAQRAKYWAGYSDPSDPRQQIEQLLKPIQAGQYTQSSRSYKMIELALEHMADPSQTPARQYEAMRQLRELMPELRAGVIRGERPIDLNNQNANSYVSGAGAAPPAAPGAGPAAAAAGPRAMPPREQRTVGLEWDVPNLGPSVWTGSGWQPKPRPNEATPAPAGVAAVPPAAAPATAPSPPAVVPPPPAATAAPVATGQPNRLDANRLPEVGALPVGLAGLPPTGPPTPLDTNRLPEAGTLPPGFAGRPPDVGTVPSPAPMRPSVPPALAQPTPLDANRLPELGRLATSAPRTLGNAMSPAGIATLQAREGGFYGDPYQDAGTGLAIGYGMHNFGGRPVTPGLHITQPQANAEMQRQIQTFYGRLVDRALQVPVSQSQYDALVSMAWNLPGAAVHVISKLNRGEQLTPADFQQSATVGGVPHRGLQGRRAEEAAPFVGTP